MRFETGKFYKHTTGRSLSILGKMKTTMYGETLIAEVAPYCRPPYFEAVGEDEDSAVNYSEITEEEWVGFFED